LILFFAIILYFAADRLTMLRTDISFFIFHAFDADADARYADDGAMLMLFCADDAARDAMQR